MAQTDFKVIKEIVQPDSRGRISLGPDVKQKNYRVLRNELGQILLEPVVAIPEREAWLYQNPKALTTLKQGLEESATEQGRFIGSFAQYADLELED